MKMELYFFKFLLGKSQNNHYLKKTLNPKNPIMDTKQNTESDFIQQEETKKIGTNSDRK